MVGSESASKRHQFTTRVDLLVALDSVGIDHLEVSQERAIVIFNRAILPIEVESGRVNDAQMIDVEVFELPPRGDDADPMALIECLINRIATTAKSN